MNSFKQDERPFLFVIDYLKTCGICEPLDELNDELIKYSICNQKPVEQLNRPFRFKPVPVSFDSYKTKFDMVYQAIQNGDSYLCNLTQATKLETNLSLNDIFQFTNAPYKLYIKDTFVVFSPESFVTINGSQINTFPMKGTKRVADDPEGFHLLNDLKETAEHNTIVDLLRNDLSMVSDQVAIKRYKFLLKVKTHNDELWQMSSEISGTLQNYYLDHPGFLFDKICPAGSICGAPKEKTLELISKTENYNRGFYTGVFGVYDGTSLQSAVMIRYIEKTKDGLEFKSGGGITFHSDAFQEYQELIHKVYVPIF